MAVFAPPSDRDMHVDRLHAHSISDTTHNDSNGKEGDGGKDRHGGSSDCIGCDTHYCWAHGGRTLCTPVFWIRGRELLHGSSLVVEQGVDCVGAVMWRRWR